MSLTKEDLYGLEQYSDMRSNYRTRVMDSARLAGVYSISIAEPR